MAKNYTCPICKTKMSRPSENLRILICLNDECSFYGTEFTEMALAVFPIWEKDKETIAAATRTANAHTSNLLAVIHRDGGHYEQEHGTDKAVADALALLPRLIQLQESVRTEALNEAAQVCESYWHAQDGAIIVSNAIRALIDKPTPPSMTLAEVKDKYFPNFTYDQLDGVKPMPSPRWTCPRCGEKNLAQQFCPTCGHVIGEPPDAVAGVMGEAG